MNNQLKYIVEPDQQGIKLFDYMTRTLALSVRFTKAASKENRIQVNGKKRTLDYILSTGDQLVLQVERAESQDILPEDLPLDIVFEDEDIIIVNKPPFMLVHPSQNFPKGSLAAGVLFHFQKNNNKSIVRLVSRLDRDTSGLVMIAKNTFAHMNLAKANEENKINKTYIAIVHGSISPPGGTIDLPIGKSEDETSHRRRVRSDGQKSITHYQTIDLLKEASVIQLKLETGRTHQIRVHLSHLKAPIMGDLLYGSQEVKLINRQALHAKSLEFPHPRTGIRILLDTELPQDMKQLIDHIKRQ